VKPFYRFEVAASPTQVVHATVGSAIPRELNWQGRTIGTCRGSNLSSGFGLELVKGGNSGHDQGGYSTNHEQLLA